MCREDVFDHSFVGQCAFRREAMWKKKTLGKEEEKKPSAADVSLLLFSMCLIDETERRSVVRFRRVRIRILVQWIQIDLLDHPRP